jgi:hypothetical protein
MENKIMCSVHAYMYASVINKTIKWMHCNVKFVLILLRTGSTIPGYRK